MSLTLKRNALATLSAQQNAINGSSDLINVTLELHLKCIFQQQIGYLQTELATSNNDGTSHNERITQFIMAIAILQIAI